MAEMGCNDYQEHRFGQGAWAIGAAVINIHYSWSVHAGELTAFELLQRWRPALVAWWALVITLGWTILGEWFILHSGLYLLEFSLQ
jgi:hypothetical protein